MVYCQQELVHLIPGGAMARVYHSDGSGLFGFSMGFIAVVTLYVWWLVDFSPHGKSGAWLLSWTALAVVLEVACAATIAKGPSGNRPLE